MHKWFVWNLDPHAMLAMDETHHPITEVSLVQLVDRVLDNVRRARAKGVGSLTFGGKETLFGRGGRTCRGDRPGDGHDADPREGPNPLGPGQGDGPIDVRDPSRESDARAGLKPTIPQPGDAVFVPEFYAGRVVLWIDEALHLPIQIDLYDHEGALYEHYEHHDLKVNVGLKPIEFDPKNPAYKF